MLFSSTAFLYAFLPITAILYYLGNRSIRNYILLGCSLVFYAWGEPRYILLMVGSIAVNWTFSLFLGRTPAENGRVLYRRLLLAVAVAFNLALIAIFKYADFIIANLNALGLVHLQPPHITQPLGISFYSFQIISYIVDVYWGRVKPQRNPLVLATYICLFPHLIAGPIVRYATIEHDLVFRRETLDDAFIGVNRFIVGLGKKVIIAKMVAATADAIFALSGPALTLPLAWVGALAYTLQIYFDFSGYSDMAIGLARIFGFHFNENFNYPYIARSVTDFWRRWHMSLSSFFRDYLYIPLGGNRVPRLRWLLNIAVVWFLTGLWHGSSWHFVVWGVYYALLLVAEKMLLSKILARLPAVLQHLYALLAVVLGWVIFRSADLPHAVTYLLAMFDLTRLSLLNFTAYVNREFALVAVLGIVGSLPVLRGIENVMASRTGRPRLARVAMQLSFLCLVLALSLVLVSSQTFSPFIYFRF